MSTEDPRPMTAPPEGWYPGPDGTKRYWDGGAWLDLPAPPETAKKRRRMLGPVAIGIAVVAVLALTAGFWVLRGVQNERAEVQELLAELQSQQLEADDREAQEAEAAAQEEADTEAEEAREKEKEQREIERRQSQVVKVEEDIAEMAEEHLDEGLIEGEVLDVSCTPVGGGSVDALLDKTTIFECFVGTEKLSGNRYRGYDYQATMNWNTGRYTYGFGKP